MQDNYFRLLKEIQKDLEREEKMQLSMMGRIAAIKTNILPKVLFFFKLSQQY